MNIQNRNFECNSYFDTVEKIAPVESNNRLAAPITVTCVDKDGSSINAYYLRSPAYAAIDEEAEVSGSSEPSDLNRGKGF